MDIKNAIKLMVSIQQDARNNKNTPYSEGMYQEITKMFDLIEEGKITTIDDQVYIDDVVVASVVWTSEVNKKTLCNHKWKAKIIWESDCNVA